MRRASSHGQREKQETASAAQAGDRGRPDSYAKEWQQDGEKGGGWLGSLMEGSQMEECQTAGGLLREHTLYSQRNRDSRKGSHPIQ